MTPIFNYNSLQTSLDHQTHSLHIEITNDYFNSELLFELESILSWTASHIEINSIVISSQAETLQNNFDPNDLLLMDIDKLKLFFKKLKKIIYALFHLPQTIVFDFANGATGIGMELGLGADLRIASAGATFCLNHLGQGQIPNAGGIGFLELILGTAHARNLVLSGKSINTQEAKECGLLLETYENRNTCLNDLLTHIDNQGPIQRIQTKRAFLERIMHPLRQIMEGEEQITWNAMVTEDWKEFVLSQKESRSPKFTTAQDMSTLLKAAEAQEQ